MRSFICSNWFVVAMAGSVAEPDAEPKHVHSNNNNDNSNNTNDDDNNNIATTRSSRSNTNNNIENNNNKHTCQSIQVAMPSL